MRRRALPALAAALSALALAGCGTGGASHSQPSAAPDPSIKEAAGAASSFDVGHTVHVTPAGLRPQSLASLCCAPVVFKNETNTPISIVFFIYKIDSGPIAPGATWQWVPGNPQSVAYHLGGDANQAGHIQVESPNW